MRIGQNVTLANLTRAVGDTVRLLGGSKVWNVISNELLKNRDATIGGTVTENVTLPVTLMPAVPTVAPGTLDVTVERNQTRTLPARAYGNIVVKRGGTLTLTGGLYEVVSLRSERNSTVGFTAATDLRLANELSIAKASSFGSSVPSVLARQIKVTVIGDDARSTRNADDDDDGVEDGELSPTAASFGQNVSVKANVFAPNGTVWLKKGAAGTGSFLGKRVQIGENVTLTLDSAY